MGPGRFGAWDSSTPTSTTCAPPWSSAIASGDADTELRLVAALWPYWHVRGHLAEGTDRLEAAIARDGATGLGCLHPRGLRGGDPRLVGRRLRQGAGARGGAARGRSRRRLARGTSTPANKLLSHVTLRERKFAAAERYSKRTLALARQLDSDHDVSTAQLNLAVVYLDWGRTEAAIPMLEEVLAYNRRNGIVEGAGFALLNLGEADYHLGDLESARARVRGSARTAFASVGFKAHVGHALTGLAGVEASSGRHAGRGAGCSVVRTRCMAAVGASKDDFDPTLAATVEAEARAHLGDDGFVVAYEEGRRAETRR